MKLKVCWQCLAMFCLYTSSKLSHPYPCSLTFHWKWRWWDQSRLPFKIISTLTNHRTVDQLNGISLVETIAVGRNFVVSADACTSVLRKELRRYRLKIDKLIIPIFFTYCQQFKCSFADRIVCPSEAWAYPHTHSSRYKGQLISERNFGVFKSPKKPIKF